MKASRVAGLLASLFAVNACGGAAVRSYAMPVAAGPAPAATDSLMACATQRGMTPSKTEHGVAVKIDANASVEYTMQADKPTNMDVTLSKDVAKADSETAFNTAKSKGDELWTCANTPAVALTGTCGQLNSCYTEVASSLCNADDAHCKETFTMKPGMDEASCKSAMGNVSASAEPLKSNKPSWQLPASCGAPAAPATAAAAPEPAPTPVASISGDWMVSVAYKWSCAMGKKEKKGADKGSWTMKVAGNGPDTISGEMKGKKESYSMSGNGSPTTVHLCGSMPLNGQGGPAANHDAKVCITADRSGDAKSYKGKAEGSYVTEKGTSCKLLSADVELSQ